LKITTYHVTWLPIGNTCTAFTYLLSQPNNNTEKKIWTVPLMLKTLALYLSGITW